MIEKTLLIIKPDAVKNKVVGKIITILEDNNIDIIEVIKISLNRADVELFYLEHKSKPFFSELVDFMLSGPVFALILKDFFVISKIRKLVGNTNYKLAEAGTIRSMFASSLTENAVHASDSHESFLRESKIIFKT